jgi:hypothetical protein
MINTHCHPFNPALPSIVLCIAVIIIPAKRLPICPTAVKMAVRFAISEGLLLDQSQSRPVSLHFFHTP